MGDGPFHEPRSSLHDLRGPHHEPIRLGYACINTALREDDIFSSRGIILKNANLKGRKELERLVTANIQDTLTILRWNEDHGVRNFRLSSVVFPHYTNPDLEFRYHMDFADRDLKALGDFARCNHHRITTHPDHFSYQIASPSPIVAEHAVADLAMHDDMLSRIGLGDDSIMTVHGGGVYGDRKATLERWEREFLRLPDGIRRRIVIENDEWNWSVDDLLPLCEKLRIPLVFDWFHNTVSSHRAEVTDDLLRRILATWGQRRPLMHYSEQDPKGRRGAHSQLVESLPGELLSIPQRFRVEIDVDLEVKLKEQAVLKMYRKYFDETKVNGRLVWMPRVVA